jgi:hypothetical protein
MKTQVEIDRAIDNASPYSWHVIAWYRYRQDVAFVAWWNAGPRWATF